MDTKQITVTLTPREEEEVLNAAAYIETNQRLPQLASESLILKLRSALKSEQKPVCRTCGGGRRYIKHGKEPCPQCINSFKYSSSIDEQKRSQIIDDGDDDKAPEPPYTRNQVLRGEYTPTDGFEYWKVWPLSQGAEVHGPYTNIKVWCGSTEGCQFAPTEALALELSQIVKGEWADMQIGDWVWDYDAEKHQIISSCGWQFEGKSRPGLIYFPSAQQRTAYHTKWQAEQKPEEPKCKTCRDSGQIMLGGALPVGANSESERPWYSTGAPCPDCKPVAPPAPDQSEGEDAESQIARLAKFILEECKGYPNQSESAIDTAIRIIRERFDKGYQSGRWNAANDLRRDIGQLFGSYLKAKYEAKMREVKG